MVIADAEARDDLEPGEPLHECPIDLLVGIGDGKRPYAISDAGQEGLAVFGFDQPMDGERRLQTLCQERLRWSNQQNIWLVVSHVTPPHHARRYVERSSKNRARSPQIINPTGCSMRCRKAASNAAPRAPSMTR